MAPDQKKCGPVSIKSDWKTSSGMGRKLAPDHNYFECDAPFLDSGPENNLLRNIPKRMPETTFIPGSVAFHEIFPGMSPIDGRGTAVPLYLITS